VALNLLKDEVRLEYQFDLEKRATKYVALVWLAEFAAEVWATPEQLGWLTFALNELLPPHAPKLKGASNARQRFGGLGWL